MAASVVSSTEDVGTSSGELHPPAAAQRMPIISAPQVRRACFIMSFFIGTSYQVFVSISSIIAYHTANVKADAPNCLDRRTKKCYDESIKERRTNGLP